MKRTLFIICALLFVSAGAFGQSVHQKTAQDASGHAIANALVKVCALSDTTCASASTIYSDNAGTVKANPFTADATGNYEFWAAGGDYTVQVAKAGFQSYTYHASLGLSATANNVITGTIKMSGAASGLCGVLHETSCDGAVGNGTTDDTAAFQAAHDGTNGGPGIYLKNLSYAIASVNVNKSVRIVGSGSPGWNSTSQPTQIVCTSATLYCFLVQSLSGNTTVLQEGPTFEDLTLRDSVPGTAAGGINIQSTNHVTLRDATIRDFSKTGAAAINIDGSATGSTDASYSTLFNVRTRNVDTAIRTKQAGIVLLGASHFSFNTVGLDASDATNNQIRIYGAKFEHTVSGTSAVKIGGGSHQLYPQIEPSTGLTNTIGVEGTSTLKQSRIEPACGKTTVCVKLPAGASNNFVDVSASSSTVAQPLSDLGDGTLAQMAGKFWYLHSNVSANRSGHEYHAIKLFSSTTNIATAIANGGECEVDSGFVVPIVSLTRVSGIVSGVLAWAWPNTTAVNGVIVDAPNGNNATAFAGTQALTFSDSTHFTYAEALADDATPSSATGGWLWMVPGSCRSVTTPGREVHCWGGRGSTTSSIVPLNDSVICEDHLNGGVTYYTSTGNTAGTGTATMTQRFKISANGVQIGVNGTALGQVIQASGTLTFTAIAAQTCQEQPLTVTNASTTNFGVLPSPRATLGNTNLNWSAWVSAAGTVQVRVCNPTVGSITPSAVTWGVTVNQ